MHAVKGHLDNGLVFCSAKANEIQINITETKKKHCSNTRGLS